MAREISCEDKSRNNTNNMVSSEGGFCYSEISPTSNHQSLQTQFTTSQIQHFDHDHQPNNNNTEIFNLTTGMDMIGFSKSTNTTTDHDHHHHSIQSNNSSVWKGFNKPHDHHHNQFTAGISESPSTSDHHHHHHNQNFIVGPDHHQSGAWQENNIIRPFMVDDSSLRCVFPCEGNERPSQGLSLTLSSNNPSSIGLQAFELRHTTNIHHHQQQLNNFAHNQDGFLGNKSQNNLSLLLQQQQQAGHFELRNCKFLSPAQDILNEFCSLGPKQTDMPKQKSHKSKLQWELDQDSNNNTNGASSSKKHSLYSLEFMELQKRKTRLLSMLEEVERRYKKYCDQMKELVSSFEAVAGPGAAAVYSALASKAMSRHFRCLKDGIVAQIQATRKVMGEKDVASSSSSAPGGVPGMSRGETPRLRALDQALRQQRAFQQMSMMESHPWRPQRGLPERSVSVLRAWLFEHFLHPYPSDVDKHILARQTGLSRSQVSNWFINARVRLWKPMVEEMYVEETKEAQLDGTIAAAMAAGSSSDGGGVDILSLVDPTSGGGGRNLTSSRPDHHDQKPTVDQLVRMDSECFSSVVNNPEKADFMSTRSTPKTLQQAALMNSQIRHQNFGRFPEAGGAAFGAVELDFSSYNAVPSSSSSSAAVLYSAGPTVAANRGFGGVSLTLGLQQHAGTAGGVNHHHNGVSLAFSPATQGSLFFPRSSTNHHHDHHNIADHDHDHDHDDDDQCQPGVQYSLLDGDQGQNLPYRNLMGAQLLHDLA